MSAHPLADELGRALSRERLATLPSGSELEPLLAARLTEARAALPDVHVPDVSFLRVVAEHLPTECVLESLERLCAPDLLVAIGCLSGDRAALAVFDTAYVVPVASQVARSHRHSDSSELGQLVRQRVLVSPDGQPPKLAQYTGRAPLTAWLRMVATRIAITMERRAKPLGTERSIESDDAIADMISNDVELAHIRSEYGAAFKTAFHEALGSLEAQDRTVLRMSVLDGLSIDEIASLYQVHRATAARWLVAIREQLFKGTRQRLADRLQLANADFESLVGVLMSRLDVSLQRVLDELGPDRTK
ncbi:putative DNA-binding regulatory protein [Labilithrix luteola]|uniref:Putative DNA-binding regulatory protein n=1 Tax=Labilithrix luteola TaxID=1391654 RepID=A0A0K1PMK5_9BACT|nr:sigma factor-like helix-turn-helix DNA-binding protein [Labilithrix luteola]AKU94753.1 putative DNA-binding regulatory protein [Labilithrix luteola]